MLSLRARDYSTLLVCLLSCTAASSSKKAETVLFELDLSSQELTSSHAFTQTRLRHQRSSASCSVQVNGLTHWGRCRTPSGLSGVLRGAALLQSNGQRLEVLVPGTLSGDEKTWPLDLASGTWLRDQIPLNPQTKSSMQGPFIGLSLDWLMMDVSFLATPQDDVQFSIRNYFSTNLAQTDPAFSSCVDPSTILFSSIKDAYAAQAGDFLLCKGAPNTPCTTFSWINKATQALVPTRPTFPEQLPTRSLSGSRCSSQPRVEMNRGFWRLDIKFATPLSFDSLSTSPNTYTLRLDLDLDRALFIPSMLGFTGLEAMTEEEVLTNVQNILLKPPYVRTRQSNASTEDSGYYFEGTVLPQAE
jgi:hypothetical protein